MGGAPVIETIRPGVQFTPPAAAAFRRLEARLGREADVNSTYRDWATQMGMYLAWNRYVESGYRPALKPNHSRAIHPSISIHCQGNAWDSDDWRVPGFNDLAAEYGFIRTAANDPTEQHHFEYQSRRDQHYGEPVPTVDVIPSTPIKKKDNDMYAIRENGKPDSGVIIRPGVPPYALEAQVFETEASTYDLEIKDLPDWRYGTAVREQWTAFNTAERFRADAELSAESVQEIADATREAIIAPERS